METIIEGFICPQCFHVLQSPSLLLEHFEVAHAEDKLNKIKGFLGKAKWLLGQESDSESFIDKHRKQTTEMIHPYSFQTQEPGVIRSHTDYFKEIKDKRVDRFVIETNKRMIRLGKLIQFDPTKQSNRRDYEKSIVKWAIDSESKTCGSCGKSFSLGRRKHHCRICGNIICSKCSHYLLYEYAAKISQNKFDERIRFFVEEDLKDENDKELLRSCKECMLFIERKLEQIKFKNYKPAIILLYEDIKTIVDSTISKLPEYSKLATSLMKVGSKNDLIKTQELRCNILSDMDRIQTLNKRISNLDDSSSPKLQALKFSISSVISSHLQNISKHLVPIPTEEQLEQLRLQRKKRMEQINEEQRKNMNMEVGVQPVTLNTHHVNLSDNQDFASSLNKNQLKINHRRAKSSEGVLDVGWQPRSVPKDIIEFEKDPLQQQIDILRWFIAEAQRAGRVDEVESLRRELKMLRDTTISLK